LKFELQRLLSHSIQTCVVLILGTFTPAATNADIKSQLIQAHPATSIPAASQDNRTSHFIQAYSRTFIPTVTQAGIQNTQFRHVLEHIYSQKDLPTA
jgi:hypothetical protein